MNSVDEDEADQTLETSLSENEGFHPLDKIKFDSVDVPSIILDSEAVDDMDSIISEDVLSNDLEKSNATIAAFTVVFIFCLFFLELLIGIIFMFSSNSSQQNQVIAHRLCKNFSRWKFIENFTESWCDQRVFNKDFKLDVQCPCFVPQS